MALESSHLRFSSILMLYSSKYGTFFGDSCKVLFSLLITNSQSEMAVIL
jgi:hypothetical protein